MLQKARNLREDYHTRKPTAAGSVEEFEAALDKAGVRDGKPQDHNSLQDKIAELAQDEVAEFTQDKIVVFTQGEIAELTNEVVKLTQGEIGEFTQAEIAELTNEVMELSIDGMANVTLNDILEKDFVPLKITKNEQMPDQNAASLYRGS